MSSLRTKFLKKFPVDGGAVVILSGGMDSCIATLLAIERFKKENVHCLTYFYRQKQSLEIKKAEAIAAYLGVANHNLIDISFLGDIVKRKSANVVGGLEMPTIQDIIGHPQPPTVVPNRNAILLMIAAAYAECNNLHSVVTGLQINDTYAYWDTTPGFVRSINKVLTQNRLFDIMIVAPLLDVDKSQEIKLCQELTGSVDILEMTLTCYNPTPNGESCGRCPSCSERIAQFKKVGVKDPIKYAIDIEW